MILLLHLSFGHVSSFVHLDFEHNLPTLYQSAKLTGAGTIAALVLWQLWLMERIRKSDLIFYGFFAAGFIFLGLDELGQLHEYIDFFIREVRPEYANAQLDLAESIGYYSSTWMLYYTPILIAAAVYFVYAAKYVWQRLSNQKCAYLTMIFFFMVTLVFELISNQGQTDPQLYQIYITIEETAEMLGATAGLAVVWEPFIKNTQYIKEQTAKNT